jgi:hypothetical protein
MTAITSPGHLNNRRHRSYPRVIKRARRNDYPVKKPAHHGTRHNGPPAIHLLIPAPTSNTTTRLTALR